MAKLRNKIVKPPIKQKNKTMQTYTCSMHPEVKSDKPGKCPKCGMELTQKDGFHNKKIRQDLH